MVIKREFLLALVHLAMALMASMVLSVVSYGTTALQVYNVVTYGADPTGAKDSSAAFNAAISAAMGAAAQPVGIIYFPPGKFLINGAVSANMFYLSFVGSGVNATQIEMGSAGSITLTASMIPLVPPDPPFHAGAVRDFFVQCNGGSTGIITQDASGIKFSNLAIQNCPTGVDLQNVNEWTEHTDFDDISLTDNGLAVHFDRTYIGTSNSSFGYNDFRIWVNTIAPGTIFQISGGGWAYNSTYSVQGNLAAGTIIFDAHSDNPHNAQEMYNDTFFVKEQDNTSNGTSYVFDNQSAYVFNPPANPVISGLGQFETGSHTQWAVPDSTTVAVTNILSTPTDLGAIAIGSGSSDVISNIFITSASQCFVKPNEAAAASLTGVWFSSMSSGQAVLSHPAGHAGAAFELWCHP